MILFIKSIQGILRFIFFISQPLGIFFMRLAGRFTAFIIKLTPFPKMVEGNVKLFFPDRDTKQITGKLIDNFSLAIFELLSTPFINKETFTSLLGWNGLEHLREALKEGRGAIIVTMHAGNYEIVANGLDHLGFKLNSILRDPNDPFIKIVNRSRKQGKIELINTVEEDMFKTSIQKLAKNECVCILADTGALESRHVIMPFLGKNVPMATGWVTLAQRSGAQVIPALCRKEGGKNIVSIFTPLKVTVDSREEVIMRIRDIFENFVHKHPDQWAMFLNAYETRRMINNQ
jgi:KDO2-lipid IV(A) lauroyltransferase